MSKELTGLVWLVVGLLVGFGTGWQLRPAEVKVVYRPAEEEVVEVVPQPDFTATVRHLPVEGAW